MNDEWDIFTSGSNKPLNASSKSSPEISNPSNTQNKTRILPTSFHLKQHVSQRNSQTDNNRSHYNSDNEEEDEGGVALQYIVHDNGDLEVVQRAMPSAAFSDRRSVDTPVPEDIMSPHPDVMECANANGATIQIKDDSLISEKQPTSNQMVCRNNETSQVFKNSEKLLSVYPSTSNSESNGHRFTTSIISNN